jgi:CPA1 family monovalent cation:H+ antiporter
MELYEILTALTFLAAVFGYINARFIKLPTAIGLMLIAILFSLVVIGLSYFDDTLYQVELSLIKQIDFEEVVMNYMLSFLLFAGALHTHFQQLKNQRWPILLFATLGILISTFLVGTLTFFLLAALGIEVNYVLCLLFGALISPTDPIAVLGILKKANVPKKLETKIVGESLFNDGVGVVIFLTLFGVAAKGSESIDPLEIAELFGLEVFGGILLGVFIGWVAFMLMKSIDDFSIEIIITLATVMVGTVLAHKLHVSAPLAMVAAGLVVGNDRARSAAMSEVTERYVDKFWELLDILLNAILFVLIGMEMLVLVYDTNYILAGVLCIPIVLLCRYLSLLVPVKLYEKKLEFVPRTNLIMTWGGLRGGISIALAFTLTADMHRDMFLILTYIVVAFSILIQGLTIEKLVKRVLK